MRQPILAIDKDIKRFSAEEAGWLKTGFSSKRIDTMQEAIEKLAHETFYFIAINADTVTYLPLLKTMSDLVSAKSMRILIIDSNFTVDKQKEAFQNGADGYVPFQRTTCDNVKSATAYLERCSERDKRPKALPEVIVYENFLLFPKSRQLFLNEERLELTKMEYDILSYFIINHDRSLSHKQIYNRIWKGGANDSSHKALWNFIDKLRRKITALGGASDYIITERNFGYRFSSRSDNKTNN